MFIKLLLLFLAPFLLADEFDSSYIAQPGDVFSAEMFNQQHDNIKKRLKAPSNLDLIGKWSCKETLFNPSGRTGFTSFDSGLYLENSPYEATFKNDGDGTFSVTNFMVGPNLNGAFHVVGGALFVQGEFSPEIYTIHKYSKDKVSFRDDSSIIVCNLTKTSSNKNAASDSGTWNDLSPKSHPTGFSASLSGTNVTLNWADNATDETGYKIMRKNSRKGSFALISTTSANATSYVDTISSSDSGYWYKVVPINSSGDGKASKIVRVSNSSASNDLTFVAGSGIDVVKNGNTITISSKGSSSSSASSGSSGSSP